jgi:hypothetical protein
MLAGFGLKCRSVLALGFVVPMILLSAFAATGANAAPLRGTPHPPRTVVNRNLNVAINFATIGDTLTISGTGFTAGKDIRFFLVFGNGQMTPLRGWKAGRSGSFDVIWSIPTYPAGTTFRVLARVPRGMRVMSNTIAVP